MARNDDTLQTREALAGVAWHHERAANRFTYIYIDYIYVKGIMYCLFSRVVLRNCMITDDFVFSKGRVIITF